MRKIKTSPLYLAALVTFSVQPVLAQNYSAPGNSWSGGWGFRSVSDRNVALQKATTIKSAEESAGPTTVVNTTNYYSNDNRTNYVDVSTSGEVTTDYHIGDRIGQNTNSVGSMNTGTTNIDIVGSNNSIVAENSAENTGCVDGSALTNSMGLMGLPDTSGSLGLSGLVTTGSAAPNFSSSFGNIASPFQDCTR